MHLISPARGGGRSGGAGIASRVSVPITVPLPSRPPCLARAAFVAGGLGGVLSLPNGAAYDNMISPVCDGLCRRRNTLLVSKSSTRGAHTRGHDELASGFGECTDQRGFLG